MNGQDESLFKFEISDGIVRIGANITKREWFAGMAMSFLARPSIHSVIDFEQEAKACFEMADAMLAEEEKK